MLSALRLVNEKSTGAISSRDAAMNRLQTLAGKTVDVKAGPMLIGPLAMLEDPSWVATVAAIYLAAFNSNIQCFPYFSDSL